MQDASVSVEQIGSEKPLSTLNWSDAKKFNAQKIRRRMKEQHERFGYKGKMVTTNATTTPVLSHLIHAKTTSGGPNPGLTIAVTMSEDGEDTSVEHDDANNANNESVWAMMEHYQCSKDEGSQITEQTIQHAEESGRQPFLDSSLGYDSYSFQSSECDSSRKYAKQNIFVPLEKTPAKIEWQENKDGELVQNYLYSQVAVSPLSAIGGKEDLNNHTTPARQVVPWTGEHNGQTLDYELEEGSNGDIDTASQHADFFPKTCATQSQPTPARLMLKWQDEKKMEDGASTPPVSILQESLIQSDCQQSNGLGLDELSSRGDESEVRASHIVYDAHELSVVPLQKSEAEKKDVLGKLANEPVQVHSQVQLVQIDDHESCGYLTRIKMLEQSLKEQRNNTDGVQSKLKDRVVELEQALRATAATPRGTIVQENPLKTLLDRNQTLVKEVRFADQTCVELSSKISAFEEQNKMLQGQVSSLKTKNDFLLQEIHDKEERHAREIAEKQVMIDRLSSDLDLEHEENLMKADTGTRQSDSSIEELKRLGQDDPEVNSSISTSSDILSTEMSKTRSENDFLGRQLGIVQEKLDRQVLELEQERCEFQRLETHWKKEIEKHLSKIRVIENSTKQRNPYDEVQASSRLLDSEQRVFDLEKELASAKASIVALKRLAERMDPENEFCAVSDNVTCEKVQEALTAMYNQYQDLEVQTKDIIDTYIERIEKLNLAVEYLRSSLLFESESLSSHVQEESGLRMMDATIESSQNSRQEDQILELMEEARSPPISKFNDPDEASSDLDDISQLFSEEATIESVSKYGSLVSATPSPEHWKEPLEAAIKECQRVRERSMKLKKEIDSQKTVIRELELENGRLCLEASRRVEEKNMVEKALEEAKQLIADLESKIQSIEDERDKALNSDNEKGEYITLLGSKNREIESQLNTKHAKQEILEERIKELEQLFGGTKVKLEEVTSSCARYKAKCDDLTVQQDRKTYEVMEKKNAEISKVQQTLKKAESREVEFKQQHQETVDRLALALEEKAVYEKKISELQSQKQDCVSDAEDRILESQCNLEAIRCERAELRSKLSRKEKELVSLTDSSTAYREKTQKQLDQNVQSIRRLQSEGAAIYLQFDGLECERKKFCQILSSFDLCSGIVSDLELVGEIFSSSQTDGEKCVKALSHWSEALPRLAETFRSLSRTKDELDELRREAEALMGDVTRLQRSEKDCKKQLEHEREQNEKFYELLSQAELEMERSAKQIREMSGALSTLQQKELEANEKVKATEMECAFVSQDFKHMQNEMTFERNQLQMKIADLTADLENKESHLSETRELLSSARVDLGKVNLVHESRQVEENRLRATVSSLESKCSRLREYIKKLTNKCEEWEVSYERQARSIEKLESKNLKIREKATEFASRYHKLKGDIKTRSKSHSDDRVKWTNERSTLYGVQVRMQEELDLIAKELDEPY